MEAKFLQLCSKPNKIDVDQFNHLANQVNVNCVDEHGRTPLMLLCINNQNSSLIELIKHLLYIGTWKHSMFRVINLSKPQQQININQTDNFKYSALYYLCSYYNHKNLINIIKLFIEKGVNLNFQGKHKFTIMHIIVSKKIKGNLLDIVNLLLSNKFSVNLKDYQGRNSLHLFCENHSFDDSNEMVDIIQTLLAAKIDIDAQTIYGKTFLHFLCEKYSVKGLAFIIQSLLEFNIQLIINTTDSSNNTALHYLCKNYITQNNDIDDVRTTVPSNDDVIDVVELFVEHGIHLNVKNYDNETALFLLCQETNKPKKGLNKIINFIIKQGADVLQL